MEQVAQTTKVEAGIQKAAVEPERKRTEELKGSRSLMEPEGRGVAGGVES